MMKTNYPSKLRTLLLISMIVLSSIGCNSQPDVVTLYPRTTSFTGVITSVTPFYIPGDYSIVIGTANVILRCNSDTTKGKSFNVNREYNDILVISNGKYVLNPKYANKTLKIICEMGADQIPGWCIVKIEVPETDDYKGASCKVYATKDTVKELIGFCESGKIYVVEAGINSSGAAVQNGNEICNEGNGKGCIKVAIKKDGYIVFYQLPDVVNETVTRIQFVESKKIIIHHQGDDKILGTYIFTGDKEQAALIMGILAN